MHMLYGWQASLEEADASAGKVQTKGEHETMGTRRGTYRR